MSESTRLGETLLSFYTNRWIFPYFKTMHTPLKTKKKTKQGSPAHWVAFSYISMHTLITWLWQFSDNAAEHVQIQISRTEHVSLRGKLSRSVTPLLRHRSDMVINGEVGGRYSSRRRWVDKKIVSNTKFKLLICMNDMQNRISQYFNKNSNESWFFLGGWLFFCI